MKKQKQTGRNARKLRLSALLTVLVIFSSYAGGCRRSAFSNKESDVPEMARIIIDSMQDQNEAESNFNLIPEDQKDGITYSAFYEYVGILNKMLPNRSSALSFEIVSGEEKAALLAKIAENTKEDVQTLNQTCIPIKVNTSIKRISDTPVYFYLQRTLDGKVYLGKEWIQCCAELYAFSVHYFEVYKNDSVNDVVSLLPFSNVDPTILRSKDVLREKAKEMMRFYSVNVKSAFADYELSSIDATGLTYIQPEVLDNHLQTQERIVRFTSDVSNNISVNDSITSELKTTELYLAYNGYRSIRIGDSATPGQVVALFGKPVSVSCGPVQKVEKQWDGSEKEYRNILVRYRGFTITVYGTYEDEEDWDGRYVRFRLWNTNRATIGLSLSPNSTTWDVLKLYPFADNTDYCLQVRSDGEDYKLKVNLEEQGEEETQSSATEEGGKPISELVLSWER